VVIAMAHLQCFLQAFPILNLAGDLHYVGRTQAQGFAMTSPTSLVVLISMLVTTPASAGKATTTHHGVANRTVKRQIKALGAPKRIVRSALKTLKGALNLKRFAGSKVKAYTERSGLRRAWLYVDAPRGPNHIKQGVSVGRSIFALTEVVHQSGHGRRLVKETIPLPDGMVLEQVSYSRFQKHEGLESTLPGGASRFYLVNSSGQRMARLDLDQALSVQRTSRQKQGQAGILSRLFGR